DLARPDAHDGILQGCSCRLGRVALTPGIGDQTPSNLEVSTQGMVVVCSKHHSRVTEEAPALILDGPPGHAVVDPCNAVAVELRQALYLVNCAALIRHDSRIGMHPDKRCPVHISPEHQLQSWRFDHRKGIPEARPRYDPTSAIRSCVHRGPRGACRGCSRRKA